MRSFRKHLDEQMKDPKFRKAYNEEKKYIELAVKIANERNRLGISQADLAKKASITQQQLSRVENGANCNVQTLVKVCSALGLRLKVDREGKKSTHAR
ncbi:MAG: XRE family transcriptional regulator [Spirochaetes bacterium]|nr:MAG: XRE family transcriptional regulator [Spirochaetota bacterium]